MHASLSAVLAMLAIVLFNFAAFALALPTSSVLTDAESYSSSRLNMSSIKPIDTSSLESRTSSSTSTNGDTWVYFAYGASFMTCVVNKKDKNMCTLAFVGREDLAPNDSTAWMAVYDHECNWMGGVDSIRRIGPLQTRWSLPSKLKYFVDIKVAWTINVWSNLGNIQIWYGSNFVQPFGQGLYPGGAYEYKSTIAGNQLPVLYEAFRAPFDCR